MQVSDLVSDAFSTTVYLKPSIQQKHVGVSFGNVGWTLCSYTYRNLLAQWKTFRNQQIGKVRRAPMCSQGREIFCSRKGVRTFLRGGFQHPLLFLRRTYTPVSLIDHPYPLSIRETAKALGVSRSTVYRLINDGELDRSYIRSLPKIMPEDIDRYLRKIARDQKIREASDDPWR
jgi:excisionase family DNA binding protein